MTEPNAFVELVRARLWHPLGEGLTGRVACRGRLNSVADVAGVAGLLLASGHVRSGSKKGCGLAPNCRPVNLSTEKRRCGPKCRRAQPKRALCH